MKKIFVNGTFDILHRGHLEMLRYAKSLGTVLVAIDSHRRVQELKGLSRPINSIEDRIFYLENLKSVDQVRVFDTDIELINLIKNWQTDIMVKGSDYKGKPIVGSEHCNHIEYFDVINDYSTTKTIQRIVDRR
jgi:D-beta-D-heptose 7-phosphate kinase/D-beta-D-heptose 1-phosphate adenosyltransferase